MWQILGFLSNTFDNKTVSVALGNYMKKQEYFQFYFCDSCNQKEYIARDDIQGKKLS